MLPIKIRTHHLLCIQGFQGYGYSKKFVDNMRYVIDCLNSTRSQIELITDCDIICSLCPHNKNGICVMSHTSDIKILDNLVLDKLDLKEHTIMSSECAFSLVNNKLCKISDVKEICENCNWKEKCRWYLSGDFEQK
ncbi:MAG: DUF1284 domain-containing protein [Methanohalobium sp.]|uniref:DUF1284 domain-containing protein n=1 Tax=Methanohalobium sp. TaxID=2837493 RepID=UPI00397CEAF0